MTHSVYTIYQILHLVTYRHKFKKQVFYKLNKVLHKLDTIQNKMNSLEEKMLYPINVEDDFNVQFPISQCEELKLFYEHLNEEKFKKHVVCVIFFILLYYQHYYLFGYI